MQEETSGHVVYQAMSLCEQSDNKLGKMISKTAYGGSTIDELCFFDGKFTYQIFSNYTEQEINRNLELSKMNLENLYYPVCIKTLKNYLKKRETQVNRKVKPKVRLIQKANSVSGGFRVSCLATGFYPRHINLTLFRDGQPVADHEITGGDLLPNDDGTYQMRKSLEISAADKHKYTCSAIHLDHQVTSESVSGEPFKSVIPSVLIVLVLVFGTGAILYKCKKKRTGGLALQRLVVCKLRDNGEPGQMITRDAVRGSTTDKLLYVDKKFTYQGTLNVSAQVLSIHLEFSMRHHEVLYQAFCIKTLKGYLEKRRNQVNRKVKPKVMLLQQKSQSSRFRVTCLATGFYPRHINLTLFRDGQPVADHEITGGDLLPSGDVTYQMRKSLEIRAADKHKYTCSATHLSLDNKLDVTLEFDPGEPFKSVISSVLIVLALVLVFGTGVVIYKCRRRRGDSVKSDYSSASMKPRVRLIQKANLDSGGFRVSCLATGFYPRHINLTLFRDGQSVADREIAGGDLLPNGDGTYQMRKTLEISAADKHKYTCSATHLSLDNKLDVILEFDQGETFTSVIPSVLTVLALMLLFGKDDVQSPLKLVILQLLVLTPFPEFSVISMLDDITVGYCDSETNSCVPRGNTTNEDEEVDLISYDIKDYLQPFSKTLVVRYKNKTEGPVVHQMLILCDISDNDKPGQLITKVAFQGSTTDEMRFFDDTITYQVKPQVRLIQKANSDSGGFRVSCLATGFYPRHINLTLFRDGQPVADHEITGGDLLPNGDGTYQMRKSLEISAADKRKYTCSATHLSLDNKLDVTLEFDHGEPFKSVIPSVLTVLALMLVFGVAAAIIVWKRRRAGSHTLTALASYIRGERAFSASIMLDDITVGYYNSETKIYVSRGNNTNEDDVIDPNDISKISNYVLDHFTERSNHLRPVNTESHVAYQVMGLCEQSDNKLGQVMSKTAYRGSKIDELNFFDVKPQVRLSQKAFSDSGGFRVSCLATGFYPRHINLTLFRDGEPVDDHEITGGDLLPNGDGTYQMRKSLEISAVKHKYICSATHLSLDNKLDVTLESDHGEPFKSVIPSVLTVSALMLVFGAPAAIVKKRCAVKPRVRLIQKLNLDSGGSRVSCLATGFYPCHINVTLFRDGQPVADHEITGGDLLPNGDGT
ncbi:major histocompatibility complex class I-related gene protein-like [Labeo rohita]|uniref:Major histocompatibility complex class I-related gene protein-like n=1 Tax=Labeo rohita TaxID=84645 RepID=A0A498P0T0_LABRO|nr:major histocompatibility complex class I-related gene protein-like [Labeo rohita]